MRKFIVEKYYIKTDDKTVSYDATLAFRTPELLGTKPTAFGIKIVAVYTACKVLLISNGGYARTYIFVARF